MADDPVGNLAAALADANEQVRAVIEHLDPVEADRAMQFVLSAYDLVYDRWFNPPDFPERRCYLTLDELQLNADGTYDVYLGPDESMHPNWIDTGGLLKGIFAIRCLLLETRHLPTVEVVPSTAVQ